MGHLMWLGRKIWTPPCCTRWRGGGSDSAPSFTCSVVLLGVSPVPTWLCLSAAAAQGFRGERCPRASLSWQDLRVILSRFTLESFFGRLSLRRPYLSLSPFLEAMDGGTSLCTLKSARHYQQHRARQHQPRSTTRRVKQVSPPNYPETKQCRLRTKTSGRTRAAESGKPGGAEGIGGQRVER